jgi:hypothetical protein
MRFLAAVMLPVLMTTAAAAEPWLWQRSGTYVNDVAVARDGSVGVYADSRVLQLAPDGTVRAQDVSFDGHAATVQGLAFAPDGDLVVAGYFRKSMTLAGKRIDASEDTEEGIVARFTPDGKVRWATVIAKDTGASVHLMGVAVSKDGVVAVGDQRGAKDFDRTEGGLVVVLDAGSGGVKMRKLIDPGMQNELMGACATDYGFVVVGRTWPSGNDHAVVHALGKDGAEKWSYAGPKGTKDGRVACRGDRAFVAVTGKNDSLPVWELDATGKLAQTITADTRGRTEALSLSIDDKELVISTRASSADEMAASWSRVSRYGRDGKLVGTDEYKSTAGDDPVWIRAAHGPKGLVIAGEVEKRAAVTVRGKKLVGPTVFVVGP